MPQMENISKLNSRPVCRLQHMGKWSMCCRRGCWR